MLRYETAAYERQLNSALDRLERLQRLRKESTSAPVTGTFKRRRSTGTQKIKKCENKANKFFVFSKCCFFQNGSTHVHCQTAAGRSHGRAALGLNKDYILDIVRIWPKSPASCS